MGIGAMDNGLQGLVAYQQSYLLGAEKRKRPLTPAGDGRPPPLDMLRELVEMRLAERTAQAEAVAQRVQDELKGSLVDTYA